MKAVILESYVMEPGDLDWSGVKELVPDTVSYVRTAYEEIAPRIGDADLVLLNKCRIDENILAQCPNLKWVGIIATGTDNLDLEACRRHGVAVANVPGYSTYSVAQMTFSLLLAICQCAERYNRAMKAGHWQLDIPAEYGLLPQMELLDKTFGVYGYGSIGRQTARIARGALVDEEAVADALQSGQLAYYGADAFGTEPLPQDSRLRSLPNAILTPHIAWTTKEALQRLMDITTRNLRTWLEGSGEHIVNG